MTIDSGLFNSCATPASSEPKAASFSLSCSASRCRLISASACFCVVRSRRYAASRRRSGSFTSVTASSAGKVVPSARIASISTRRPSHLASPVVRYRSMLAACACTIVRRHDQVGD